MINSRVAFNSALMASVAASVASHTQMGSLVHLLSVASAGWPVSLRNYIRQQSAFPRCSAARGIAGPMPYIPIETQNAISDSSGTGPCSLLILLETAFYTMRQEGPFPMTQSIPALTNWTQHALSAVVSLPQPSLHQ